jgi:hypothetical protein
METSVWSYRQALKRGFCPWSYLYDADRIPVGDFEALLEGKIWGGMVIGIGCYFLLEDRGIRFVLTVYYDRGKQGYYPADSKESIQGMPIGARYRVRIGLNNKGQPCLRGLSLLQDDSHSQL